MSTTPTLLRAEDLCRELGLSRCRAYAMMASGELPVVRIGRSVRVPRVELERWLAERTVPAHPAQA